MSGSSMASSEYLPFVSPVVWHRKEWQTYYIFKYCLSICRLFSENNTPIHRLALHLIKMLLRHTPILTGVWDPAIFCIIYYLITINLSCCSFELFQLFINVHSALNSLAIACINTQYNFSPVTKLQNPCKRLPQCHPVVPQLARGLSTSVQPC